MENGERLLPVDEERGRLSHDHMAGEGPPIGSLVILRGRIIHITPITTLIRTRTSYVSIRWYDGRVPPGARMGDPVHVIGSFVTLSCGDDYMVYDAMMVKSPSPVFWKDLRDLMTTHLLLPKDWINDLS